MKPEGLVEATLFSAGRAVTLEELEGATGLSGEEVRKSIKSLVKDYEKRESSLRVVKVGSKYLLKIRDEYVRVAESLAETELPKEVLKTAALIAYHQPLKQKDLNIMLGSRIYEHVKILKEKQLVKAKPAGKTFELTTTNAFLEYFGIEASNREDVRRVLAKKAGLRSIEGAKPDSL